MPEALICIPGSSCSGGFSQNGLVHFSLERVHVLRESMWAKESERRRMVQVPIESFD